MAHSCRLQSIASGKARRQVCEVVGHNREVERGKCCSLGHFSFSFGLRPHLWSSGTHVWSEPFLLEPPKHTPIGSSPR